MAAVKKKNKGGVEVKPFQVKNHLWVFVNSLIENPTFDSQTKENMTLRSKAFGSTCDFSEKFIKQVCIFILYTIILKLFSFNTKDVHIMEFLMLMKYVSCVKEMSKFLSVWYKGKSEGTYKISTAAISDFQFRSSQG